MWWNVDKAGARQNGSKTSFGSNSKDSIFINCLDFLVAAVEETMVAIVLAVAKCREQVPEYEYKSVTMPDLLEMFSSRKTERM